ncbi:alpha/beta hydrolase [Rhodococcus sp. BP-349]|uniref:alpha/beta hydrolase n=1 Tax=unclassified Rhodococcus (in: high G+C Gram-positive bacteria) TaxID=192944 RepID=UPI001C9B7F61|nr:MULTISPECIES: alpha/beta hydrolase [unclassified Rhodococcus (in: high G+C Gram-positive bacteria)]MBY6539986.1 alpha/beta hydrolase [Rhodococcus sp. BP-363]MBY6543686.1 alpha/beta hydrolase [Rhodococcus sp. BP-369]MBY6562916.1 alpha/beta hydrolase [Rhodococcus sp. BP-370]MBY6577208.1 alpha/beta hydrolase [Rhodococcus sp. BP-364]MBY6586509.1 alpha/beta hydrolase [Rhodococcus sp. BP-358]
MSDSSERIDVVLHPHVVRDLGTVTDLVQSALAARGATGEVHVSDDVSVASGDVIVVPAPGGRVDTQASDRCVVRVDYGYVATDLSPGLHSHIRGRGLGGLRYAVDRIHHHRLHPATVESYGEHSEQFAEVRGTSGPVVALIHGGYWRAPWRLDSLDAAAIDLADRGYTTWNVEYRTPDEHGWETTAADVAAALKHAGAQAVLGHSAGGQLALRWAADARPALAVSLAGVLDLKIADDRGLGDGAVRAALGSRYTDAHAESSPRARLPLGVPQIVVVAASDDPNLNDIGREYADAARRAGDDIDLVEGPGGHFDVVDPRSEIWPAIVERIEGRLPR